MTTPRIRSLVSLAAAVAVAVALAGCAGTHSRLASSGPAFTNERPAILFENEARDYVRVYLIGEKWEWLLGRVDIGARATLRIPDAALAEDAGQLRLAVLEGQSTAVRVAGDTRATITMQQPAAAILSQRWTFSHTAANAQLTSLPRDRFSR